MICLQMRTSMFHKGEMKTQMCEWESNLTDYLSQRMKLDFINDSGGIYLTLHFGRNLKYSTFRLGSTIFFIDILLISSPTQIKE